MTVTYSRSQQSRTELLTNVLHYRRGSVQDSHEILVTFQSLIYLMPIEIQSPKLYHVTLN